MKRHTVPKRMGARVNTIVELRQTMHDTVLGTGRRLRSVLPGYYRYQAAHENLPLAVAARPMPSQASLQRSNR